MFLFIECIKLIGFRRILGSLSFSSKLGQIVPYILCVTIHTCTIGTIAIGNVNVYVRVISINYVPVCCSGASFEGLTLPVKDTCSTFNLLILDNF